MTNLNKKSSGVNFEEYMKTHTASKGEPITHTRIGDKEKNIYGGAYQIGSAEWSEFMRIYYQQVFINAKLEYLTEKQLIENGPIMIDIDLRYDKSITKRQHTPSHIMDAVMLYADKIEEMVEIDEIKKGTKIDVFVMEKSDVNILEDKTKDGIHIIIGIKMHKAQQVMLREKVKEDIINMWDDLPITNTWDDVLDDGITRGFVNWQLYGSRKPGHQAYLLKIHYQLSRNNGSWEIEEKKIADFSVEKNIEKLSARYMDHPEFELKEEFKEKFEKTKETLNKKNTSSQPNGGNTNKGKYTLKSSTALTSKKLKFGNNDSIYDDIDSQEKIDEYVLEVLNELDASNYRLKETHDYVMSLPKSYYGPGSYNKWIRVGWALANTSPKMFFTWVKFSSQENCRDSLKDSNGKFNWSCIKELYNIWCGFAFDNPDGLTQRSIMYWSKNDNPEKYEEIRKDTIDFFVNITIKDTTEFDIAQVLYHKYKDNFICVSIKRDIWYEYINNRWVEIDSGSSLRKHISIELYNIYNTKMQEITESVANTPAEDIKEILKSNCKKAGEISLSLKKTVWKNNIMREARELFYDKDFMEKLDQNPNLLCFNNYVVDFKNKIHRRGQPDDYISKCTNIDYVPYNEAIMSRIFNEIAQFMKELFPAKELHDYMWQHLASCLIGTNKNQTFNIYYGGGRNGKSKLTELMTKALGTYKATVPITLITQKRNSIGSTSSEIVQLMGVRYAVMQEPSKGDRINEGIMKEITGGDPIQGRALFKDTVTFTPQFKLVVCTNELFEDMSTDDGTWRRIRICDYQSKFLEKPYEDEKFPKSEYPYQFPLDKDIDKKFESWAPVFIAYLVKMSYELQGNVVDCRMVLSSSEKYRDGQDYLAEFSKDKLRIKEGEKIKKVVLVEEFKKWYKANYGQYNIPKGKEVHDYMDRKYGAFKLGGWNNVGLVLDDEDDE